MFLPKGNLLKGSRGLESLESRIFGGGPILKILSRKGLIVLLVLLVANIFSGLGYAQENSGGVEMSGEWKLVWQDEFDYVGLPDPDKWILEHKGDGFGNNELQFYTPRKENVWVEDGVLKITARKEKYQGRDYTSAKLMSKGKGDFLYGRFEVRAKMPKGKGVWPAVWMLPSGSKYGIWPNSGEIDIVEFVGYDPSRIHGTVHTANYNHMINTQKGTSVVVDGAADNFYVYSMEWSPSGIKWFVDDKLYYEFDNDEGNNPDNSSRNWPFDQPFYLILNLAFGGDWGGAQGLDPNFTESSMIVDYVRVYSKAE